MAVYSTYQAKARFSEVMRKVRSGQTVRITYNGREVAEIRPILTRQSIEEAIRRLEEQGCIVQATGSLPAGPIVSQPGALQRFLETRD